MKTKANSNFWQKVDKTPTCWIWNAAKNRKGYGQIRVSGKLWIAHRYSYLINLGVDPGGHVVMHKCDTPSCINPSHLKLGSIEDNNKDRDKKGRFKPLLGENNGNSKLNSFQVEKIKELYASGEHTYRSISKLFNIDHSTVGYVLNKRKGK